MMGESCAQSLTGYRIGDRRYLGDWDADKMHRKNFMATGLQLVKVKVKVKVPGLTIPYSNEDCRRRGKRVWANCPRSLRSCAPTRESNNYD